MKLDFCFSGWVRNAEIKTVTVTATGKRKKLGKETLSDVNKKLQSGEYTISLADFLNESDVEIEINDLYAHS